MSGLFQDNTQYMELFMRSYKMDFVFKAPDFYIKIIRPAEDLNQEG